MGDCLFCEWKDHKEKIIFENELAFATYDGYAVSKGHMLFMTKRHIDNFFNTTPEEKNAIFELVNEAKKMLDEKYNIIDHFDMLVKPEYGVIDREIYNLTGISQEDVENAPNSEDALKMFEDWIPDDSTLVTWSENDIIQIDDEIYFKDLI